MINKNKINKKKKKKEKNLTKIGTCRVRVGECGNRG